MLSPQRKKPEPNDGKSKNAAKATGLKKVVVASLPVDRSRPAHPYSSLALSPRGSYALVAGKGTIQLVAVGPEGLTNIRSLKIAHHFFNTASQPAPGTNLGNVRDAFRFATESSTVGNMNQQFGNNIVVTKVAWSNNFNYYSNLLRSNSKKKGMAGGPDPGMDESTRSIASLIGAEGKGKRRSTRHVEEDDDMDTKYLVADESKDDSLVAAAGSNGVVVVWNARKLLFSDSGKPPSSKSAGGFISAKTSSAAFLAKQQRTQQPEGILTQHTRAVNCMAWHPTRSGLLLTASQDGTIKLWERKLVGRPDQPGDESGDQQRSWFQIAVGGGAKHGSGPTLGDEDDDRYVWGCRATYSLGEQDAVRDICWNKHLPDIFGAVTSNGNLVVYNMHVAVKALVKIAAHNSDAASLDWHPRWPFVVATGGSSDRFVKIWDLESSLGPIVNTSANLQPPRKEHTRKENQQQNHHENSNTQGTTKSDTSSFSASSSDSIHSSIGSSSGPSIREAIIRTASTTWGTSVGRRDKSTPSGFSKHVLSVSASVTQVRWRPPSNDFVSSPTNEEKMVDRHDAMLAVVTARQTSAGGSGTLSLWSFHRPFMSLSIVEGHEEGAISDFVWIQTPQIVPKASYGSFEFTREKLQPTNSSRSISGSRRKKPGISSMDDSAIESREKNSYRDDDFELLNVSYIWQNVLSVGKDGQCIMQSFARGERRIRHVPSSCFAMANLSPFQRGYGSLQFFSVQQDVPNRIEDDFLLTGLRQDEHTENAPGIFFEEDLQKLEKKKKKEEQRSPTRFPDTVPELRFSVIDQGMLDSNGMPIAGDNDALIIAPEVLHMSRFARLYKLYPDEQCPTRAELCLYNSKVAEELNCGPLARMWKTVSSLVHSSGLEEFTLIDPSKPTNAFQFVIFRTVKSLLLERAEAGDVQTNVALCEVLQVVNSEGTETRIPGLSIKLVREWYLYYIDLLHQMCLFSDAALLIKNCKDPAIGALSQQSTTIHESCPRCGKPIDSAADAASNQIDASNSARQVCKSCRRRVAMCFICHEPVSGMFVWCPGCGHGGHLEHAVQWFGGLNGKAVRTVCPTGCGHKCNLVKMATAFPRTMSMAPSDSMENIFSLKGHQPRCMPVTTSTTK